jgi:Uma2 family endonuclease
MSAIHDWATFDNLQPEPITEEIWRELPEEFCRQVEVVNGQAIRCDSPSRTHQRAALLLAQALEAAVESYTKLGNGPCLDVGMDFDVTLWSVPRTTIRRPDLAIHDCADIDLRPLPASLVQLAIEIVSPGNGRTDFADKMAEYALARIPWYWIVRITENHVSEIDLYVLDHVTTTYQPYRKLFPEEEVSVVEVPIRIKIEWARLTGLVR